MAADPDRDAPPERSAFARFVPLATRWSDNDAYGHLNNVVYYSLFDSAVNALLIEAGLLDPATSPVIGLVVESNCRFMQPDLSRVGRGRRRGRASRPLLGALSSGRVQGWRREAVAAGRFTHVYVERATSRPVPIPDGHRAADEWPRLRIGRAGAASQGVLSL